MNCGDTLNLQTARCFPNNISLITSDLKKWHKIKKKTFRERDRELLRTVQKQLKKKTTECKE